MDVVWTNQGQLKAFLLKQKLLQINDQTLPIVSPLLPSPRGRMRDRRGDKGIGERRKGAFRITVMEEFPPNTSVDLKADYKDRH